MRNAEHKKNAFLFITVFAAAIAFRIYPALRPHLGMEALFPYGLKDAALPEIIYCAAHSFQAPLAYIPGALIAKTGASGFLLILPHIILSAGLAAAAAFAARRIAGNSSAFFAGFIAAASPFLIPLSVQLRYETFAPLFALGSIYYGYFILCADKKDFRSFFFYIVFTVLGLYSFYYSFYIIIFQNLWALISRRPRQKWFLCQAAVAALFAPWIGTMAFQLIHRTGATSAGLLQSSIASAFSQAGASEILRSLSSIQLGMYFPTGGNGAFSSIFLFSSAALFFSLFISSAISAPKRPESLAAAHFSSLVLSCVLLSYFGKHFLGLPFSFKYLLCFAPAWVLAASVSIASMRFSAFRASTVAAIVLISLPCVFFYYNEISKPDEFENIMRKVTTDSVPRDAIAVFPAYYQHVAKYYLSRADNPAPVFGLPANHDMPKDDYGFSRLGDSTFLTARAKDFSAFNRIHFIIARGSHEQINPFFISLNKSGFTNESRRSNFMPDMFFDNRGYYFSLSRNAE